MLVLFANLELALTTGALILILAGGGCALFWAKHWRQRFFRGTPSPTDDLGSFRALYEQGKLSRTEFNNIVQTLAQRAAEQAENQGPAVRNNP